MDARPRMIGVHRPAWPIGGRGMDVSASTFATPVGVGELALRGGFHGGDSLPILKGSHLVAPATDE
ncbi:hypothetical protein SSPO_071580 [Streptomyces antimycoticus]|uniref:Uncharacterized protein n=1 Tax=Streptomyces antimycoticus TaxID=68175 RepID=A0A499UUX3_9ACTN|nr:hypothetical protein SSPO_071580 [Streptomyces antimycoticus]